MKRFLAFLLMALGGMSYGASVAPQVGLGSSGGGGSGGVSTINTLTGNITLASSASVIITPSGNTLTFSAPGGGGSAFADGSFVIQNTTDATKQVKFSLGGMTTGKTLTISAGGQTTNQTLTIPPLAASDTVTLDNTTNVFTVVQTFPAATSANASIVIPAGTAPSIPSNGWMWGTTAGLFYRANGVTQGPLGVGSVTGSTSTASSLTLTTGSGTITLAYSGTPEPIANGGTNATTASGAFNNLSPMTTLGDTIYGGSSGAGTRLAGPTSGTVPYVFTSTPVAGVAQAPPWTQSTHKQTTTTDPTVSNDNTQGYSIFSQWANTTTNRVFVASNVATGAAVWNQIKIGSNVQWFTTVGTFTWTKPFGCTKVTVYCIGSGGPGGAGASILSGSASCGGGGGAPGGLSGPIVLDAATVASSETIVVAAGVTGPVGITNTNGGKGSNGNASSFGTAGHTDYVTAGGGAAGAGGTTSTGSGGAGPAFSMTITGTVNGATASTTGGAGPAGTALPNGLCGGAGGAGGGITSGVAQSIGGSGGAASINLNTLWNALLPAGGTAGGGTGTNGVGVGSGQGGAGGGSNATGNAGPGGNGANYGAGGGGGGATISTFTSGAGGNSAQGMVLVIAE